MHSRVENHDRLVANTSRCAAAAVLLRAGCLVLAASLLGCISQQRLNPIGDIVHSDVPRELDKTTIPPYRAEPPDVLLLEVVYDDRAPESPLQAGDQLSIRVSNTLPIDPAEDPVLSEFKRIYNVFVIQPDGTIDLGPEYGGVQVAGLKFNEVAAAIEKHLVDAIGLKVPKVAVSPVGTREPQILQVGIGEHLVRPDGTISLGIYGDVYVAGQTLESIRTTLEGHLAQYFSNPRVTADVLAYNSKVYYVITDGAGYGQQVVRIPFTGNETVLDAIANIEGLSPTSSQRIWVARPAPSGVEMAQTLPVDWRAISREGVTTTNYQLLPGDRVFIEGDGLVATDNLIAKVLAPVERIFGVVSLGYGTIRRIETGQLFGNSGGN